MAWQLIYTSAPRLLEAGRTGFGTVARHRSVGGMLAAAVERFSQFARLPGHDPKRVVCAHRIVTVGASTYHVLSRLRDAGSDYTGRTNHIAHHLIAEKEEIQDLDAAGITPADVLLAMPWRDAWTEGARFLDAGEEINLGVLKARPSEAWRQVTGDGRQAWLPQSAAARKGCYFITPEDAPVLELFRESLSQMSDAAWDTTFTTSLEPNDEVSDFRWIAVGAASPLRAQAEGSARQVFDLTNPASLPPPPADVPQAPVIPRHAVAASPARESLPGPAMRGQNGGALPPPPSLPLPSLPGQAAPLPAGAAPAAGAGMEGAGTMGGWSPEPRTRRRGQRGRLPLPLVLGGVLVLLACATGLVWVQLLEKQRQQDTDRITEQIDSAWKRHHLLLQETKTALKLQAADPDKAVREHAAGLLARYRRTFDKIDLYLENPDLKQDLSSPDEQHHDDFVDLCQEVGQWPAAASAKSVLAAWKLSPAPQDMLAAFEEWQERRKGAWRKFTVFFDAGRAMPRNQAAVESLLARAAALLKAEKKPGGKPQDWQRLMEEMAESLKGAPAAPGAPEWLAAWAKFEDLGIDAAGTGIQEVWAQLQKLADVPAWLKTAVAERKKKSEDTLMAAKRPKPVAPPPPAPKVAELTAEQVDAFDAKHPIYLKWVKPGEAAAALAVAVTVAGLDGAAGGRPQIRFGPMAEAFQRLEEWKFYEDSYRLKLMVKDKGEVKISGQEVTLPVLPEGSRLVALSGDGRSVLFEVRLVVEQGAAPPHLLAFSNVPKFQAAEAPGGVQTLELGSLLRRLRFVDRPVATFHLISTEGKQRDYEVFQPDAEREAGKDTYVVRLAARPGEKQSRELRRKKAVADIEDLKKAIKALDDEIARTEASNLVKAQKAQRLESLRASKGAKENSLADKEGELAAMDAEASGAPPPLEENRYQLRARFGSYDSGEFQDICAIHIHVPASAPKP